VAVRAAEGGAVVVGGVVVLVAGCVVEVAGDVVFGDDVDGVVACELFGCVDVVGGEVVVVAEPFGVAPGEFCVLDEPATSEFKFKVAAFEWNEKSPTKPATVPEITRGARFICC